MNKYWGVRLAVALLFFAECEVSVHAAGPAEISSAESILNGLRNSCIPAVYPEGLKISARSAFRLNPEYLRLNPGIDPSIYGAIAEEYEVQLDHDKFRVSVGFTPEGQAESGPRHVAAFDGVNTMCVTSKGRLMSIKRGLKLTPDNSIPLGSVIFLPFSFLVPVAESGKVPMLTPALMSNDAFWRDLKARTTVVDVDGSRGTRLRVDAGNGEYYLVQLSAENSMYPTSFELYTRDDKLSVTCLVEELATCDVNGKAFSYPGRFVFKIFASGFLRSERRVSVNEMGTSVISKDGDVFSLDPAAADVVFDEDSRSTIRIPK